jgi:hypothetical protein
MPWLPETTRHRLSASLTRSGRCGESGLKSSDLMILGNEMSKVLNKRKPMERVKRAIPKGKVYEIVQALLSNSPKAARLIETTKAQLEITVSDEFKELRRCFGEGHTFWLHLIELWDYIEPLELTE